MRLQVFVYRRSGGKRMGHLRGMPVLLLRTVGRKTGEQRVTPVLDIGTGATGALLITEEVNEEARRRNVTLGSKESGGNN